MMLGVQHLAGVAQRIANPVLDVELLLHPQRRGLEKGPEAARRNVDVGLEDALELEQRLVVETDERQVADTDAGVVETETGGVNRKALVTLLPGEPLLLGGGDDLP